jgi:O-antigen ligase
MSSSSKRGGRGRRQAAAPVAVHDTSAGGGAVLGYGLAATVLLVLGVGTLDEAVRPDTLKFWLLALGLPLTALAWLWLARPRVLWWSPAVALPAALALAALLSLAWASDAYLALLETSRWLLISLAALLALNLAAQPRGPGLLLRGLALAALAVAATGAAQHFFALAWFTQAVPPAATFINKNFAAEAVVAALPALLWCWRQAHTPGRRGFLAAAMGLCLFYLLLTTTRAAWLALALQAAALVMLRWRAWRAQPAGGLLTDARRLWPALAVPLLLALLPAHPESATGGTVLDLTARRLVQTAQDAASGGGSLATRLELWGVGAALVAEHPLLGVGAGNYEYWVQARMDQPGLLHHRDNYAHGEVLQWAAELGLPFTAVWVLLVLAWFAHAAWRLLRLPEAQVGIAVAAWLGLLGLGVVALLGFPLHLAAGSLLAGLWLGLLAAPWAQDRPFPAGARRLALGLAGVMLLAAMGIGARAWQAERDLSAGWRELRAIQAAGVAITPARQQQAAARLRAAAQGHPWSLQIQANAGAGLFLLASGAAAPVLERTVALRPHYAAGWLNLARARNLGGNRAAALRAVHQVLAIAPLSPEAMAVEVAFLGEWQDSGALARARQHVQALLAAPGVQSGGDAALFGEYARLALAADAEAEALPILEAAAAKGYEGAMTHGWRALLLHYGLKDEASALRVARQARAGATPAAWEKFKRGVSADYWPPAWPP